MPLSRWLPNATTGILESTEISESLWTNWDQSLKRKIYMKQSGCYSNPVCYSNICLHVTVIVTTLCSSSPLLFPPSSSSSLFYSIFLHIIRPFSFSFPLSSSSFPSPSSYLSQTFAKRLFPTLYKIPENGVFTPEI